MISMAASQLRRAWQFLRTLTGDDAYDRYRAHRETCHAGSPCMNRKAFYLETQRQKWSGVNRCC